MSNAKETILDAFQELLASEGERSATLDATALSAGVSKGGLLYHFPNKESLVAALCQRLTVLVQEDLALMRHAAEGPARYYVRTSRYLGTVLDKALIAVSKLRQAGFEEARSALELAEEGWLDEISIAVKNPAAALAVKLIGDGLYYEALLDHEEVLLASGRKREEQVAGLLTIVDEITRSH
ncbi:MAG: helix-turn-helix domain-containing protein [Microbacteriaceae bacterium]